MTFQNEHSNYNIEKDKKPIQDNEYYLNGLDKVKANKLSEAIELFSKAIQMNPSRKEYFFEKGLALFKMKNFAEAILNFDKAVELDPNDIRFYINKVYCLKCINKHNETAEILFKAYQIDPNHGDVNHLMSLFYHDLKHEKESRLFILKALRFNPNNPEYYFTSGRINFNGKNYTDAINDFKKALSYEENALYDRFLSDSLYESGKFQDALIYINKAINIDNSNKEYHNRKNKIETAIKNLNKI